MGNSENIEKILVDYFSGSLSERGIQEVESWKSLSEENQSLFKQYKKTWEIWQRSELIDRIDIHRAHQKVKRKISKGAPLHKKLVFWRVAAVLIPLVMISGYLLFLQIIDNSSNELTQEVTTSYGVRKRIQLADGTTVTLNSGSTLKFPSEFSKKSREVVLTGEAFFEVTENPHRPFYVNIGELSVKVLGTKFNVVAYPEENTFETTLVSGKIELVKRKNNSEQKLADVKPHDHLIFTRDKNKVITNNNVAQAHAVGKHSNTLMRKMPALSIRNEEVEKHISWVEGKLVFKNDPMEEVAKRLGRWYNVDIILDDIILADFNYTATFKNETIEQVLELLKLSAPITYQIKERKRSGKNEFEKPQIILTLNLE